MAVGLTYSDNDGKGTGFLNTPMPTKEPYQRSLNQDDLYLTRFTSPWYRPDEITADGWRWWVFNEPIAMVCRDTLTTNILALDWEITPRKSEDRDELRAVINHYTRLLERGGEYYGFDWTGFVEWIMADLQDLPFGAAAEIGRKNDSPTARVVWLKPLDGGTLYPTLNQDYPVIQYYPHGGRKDEIVTFPRHAIARTYMSPRPELVREGWGLAPPEKVYFALLMLWRGDKYYADLLLDTPPAGILDLGDMEKDSAMEWVSAFRNLVLGSPSSFKIPVLYEHTTKTDFIPFGKVPNDIMYDRITLKYAAIVAAAYGMSLSDIGLQTASASGETLAGSIRQERRTKRTGFARAKMKIKYFIESFLPDTLQFNFIDLDDELNVALGRARLATITALSQAQDKGVISAEEHRLILLGDGLFGSTNLPEEPPPDAKEAEPMSPFGKSPERPGSVGSPQPPSSGGEGATSMRSSVSVGEISNLDSHLKRLVNEIAHKIGKILVESSQGLTEDELHIVRSAVDNSLFGETDSLGILTELDAVWKGKRWFKLDFGDDFVSELSGLAEKYTAYYLEKAWLDYYAKSLDDVDVDEWKSKFDVVKTKLHRVDWKAVAEKAQRDIEKHVKMFLGKSAIFILKDVLLVEENVVDTGINVDYDNIVDEVYQAMQNKFSDFVSAAINLEIEKILKTIKQEVSE